MVKSVLSVNHQGLRDWCIQRVSAIIMAIYSLALIVYLVAHPSLSYTDWQQLFSCAWVKVATILFFLCLMWHAWIGIWTVFTDYVKPYALRCFLHGVVLFALAACFIWSLMILWSV